jgi:hypothetical protein
MGRWRDVAMNNGRLKLLALGLAILSFLAIRSRTSVRATYEVPVHVVVARGTAVLEQEPRSVQVSFRGSQQSLRDLDPTLLSVVVHPAATDPRGAEEVHIGPRDVEGHAGVSVEQVRPNRVTVAFDRETAVTVPVTRPRVVGTPLAGRVELDYGPREVVVRGPRRRMTMKDVSTEPIDVSGRTTSFVKKVPVLAGDSWVSRIEPPEITVSVTLVADSVRRTFTGVPVNVMTTPGGAKRVVLEPNRVSVTVHGRAERVSALASNDVQAYVRFVGLNPASVSNLPVRVYLPFEADRPVSVEPPAVQVSILPED